MSARARLAALLLSASLALTGCGFAGLYEVPLPGGADLGDHPYRLTAEFADVLDLVPQAAVKVNGVPVGRVDSIKLAADNHTAQVGLLVNGEVALPANATATLRQSSLLGEKYVELRGSAQPQGKLAEGAVIPISATQRNPEIEEVLGALSMLLNGGGLAQLQTIVREVNAALDGNTGGVREMLSTVDTTVRALDGQRTNITRAIDSLNRLSLALVGQTGNITSALDKLAPGLKVLNEQRGELVSMLGALDSLSRTTTDVIRRSHDNVVADLKLLEPTLRNLAASGANLPNSLQMLVTYPLSDWLVNAIKGDFTNVDVEFELDLSTLLENIGNASTPLIPIPGGSTPSLPSPVLPLPGTVTPPSSSPLDSLLGRLLPGGK